MATKKRISLSERLEAIEKWRVTTCNSDESAISTAVISALYDSIVGFLKAILRDAWKSEPEPSYCRSLEQHAATLFFWGRDFGVSQGDLDANLQFSHRLRDTVLTLLVSLGDLLSRGFVQAISESEEREALLKSSRVVSLTEDARLLLAEPLEPPNYDGEDIEGLCLGLRNTIESLQTLSSSLEAIADDGLHDEEARAWVQLKDRAAHEYFVDLISTRFPSANQQLVQALGQSNWDRYNYVQKLRESSYTDVVVVDKAKSEFYDSGIGSSAPLQSIILSSVQDYAATIMSSRAESSHKRLPLLPTGARSGEPFECEICHREVRIKRTREWKKHVFEDICAYTCIFPECSSTRVLFKDREAITSHLSTHHDINDHKTTHICPLCLEKTVGGGDILSLHFARHMEEIALGVLPQDAASEEGSEATEDEYEQASTQRVSPNEDQVNALSEMRIHFSNLEQLFKKEREKVKEEEKSSIQCICGDAVDDEPATVLCEVCDTWQHILCYYGSGEDVPDIHECVECNPRDLDSTRARDLQPQIGQRPQFIWHTTSQPKSENPPCNTLWVGNLPTDASEDDLKAVFSNAHGFRRLCFRSKSNGPMCLVEFIDIDSATRSLLLFQGYRLHNSRKGGIRLSYSNNPLGVRTGWQTVDPTCMSTLQKRNGASDGLFKSPEDFKPSSEIAKDMELWSLPKGEVDPEDLHVRKLQKKKTTEGREESARNRRGIKLRT